MVRRTANKYLRCSFQALAAVLEGRKLRNRAPDNCPLSLDRYHHG